MRMFFCMRGRRVIGVSRIGMRAPHLGAAQRFQCGTIGNNPAPAGTDVIDRPESRLTSFAIEASTKGGGSQAAAIKGLFADAPIVPDRRRVVAGRLLR